MRARLGQHFLKDPGIARRIADAVPLSPRSTLIEIGPGRGALTRRLLERALEAESEFICIERDPELAAALPERLKKITPPIILTEDARTALPKLVASLPEGREYAVVGNLPYYLTGNLFRILGELPHLPRAAVFMVQREVALRLTAAAPHLNLLAVSVQAWARTSLLFPVPSGAFAPKPKVESAIVSLIATRKTPPTAEYYRAVRLLFRQPRKTLLNNLAAAVGREEAMRLLTLVGLDPADRPQALSPESILILSEHLGP